jgi:hypothetical protein
MAPVEVVATLMDRAGTRVGEGKETLSAARFHAAGRTADYESSMSIARLPPGAYLLTFDVSLGPARVTRAVQFTVVPRT